MTIVALAISSSAAWSQPVTKVKIAELACHRVERLVLLKKIDASFSKQLERIDVIEAKQGNVAFQAMVSQTQPENGQPIQLQLAFDVDGKPISFQLVAGGTAGPDPKWPGQNSVSLTENSLHYVLDHANDAKIKNFYDGFTFMVLSAGNVDGTAVSRAQLQSSLTTDKMNIYLNLDGTFHSAEFVQ